MVLESVNAGVLSILPPIIAIICALFLKEILSSLLIGIFAGTLIYSCFSGLNFIYSVKLIFDFIIENLANNADVLDFTSLLGAISQIMIDAGVASGYTKWSEKKIKNKKSAQLSSILLSLICSIDDTFLCLTVGNVMRPIIDKNKISRARFAYILDMMASPMVVLMPISSWAAAIVSCMNTAGISGMQIFLKSIVFNFYAVFAIFLAILSSVTNKNFGIMKKFEQKAENNNDISADLKTEPELELESEKDKNKSEANSKIFELVLPILVLILGSIFILFDSGGFFSGKSKNFSEIISNANSSLALNFGSLFSILLSLVLFVPKKLKFSKFMDSVCDGIKSVTFINVMLVLAWSMTSMCQTCLSTGDYIKNMISSFNISETLIPAMSFTVSLFLSFAIGSSWATFGILIPIIANVTASMNSIILVLSMSAILSGCIAGVNCSPVASMGLLASAGSGCKHLCHISSQVPYAILISVIAAIGFILAPVIKNIFVLYFVLIFIMTCTYFLISGKKTKF